MTAIDRHALAPVIAAKVRAASFGPGGGTATRHAVIDDLLPADVALRIHAVFPVGDGANFIRRVSFRERKSTSAALDNFDPVLKEISRSPSRCRGAGGGGGDQRCRRHGARCQPQRRRPVDDAPGRLPQPAHRQQPRRRARPLPPCQPALLCHPRLARGEWRQPRIVGRGGASPGDAGVALQPADPDGDWHSVKPVKVEGVRCCVSSHYFSKASPTGEDYFHVTKFSARPEQPLRRAYAHADGLARNLAGSALGLGRGRERTYKAGSAAKD